MGAAETGAEGSNPEGAAKLNVVIVGAADSGPWESGADEEGGAKLYDVSTSIRSDGEDGISTG